MIRINYVTTSAHKEEELAVLCDLAFESGRVSDLFRFEVRRERITEHLEVDLDKLVSEEAVKAYQQLRVPCVVEHAGLILLDHASAGYPGGLTKAMWNALGDKFVNELGGADRAVVARAVVAYCDGMRVRSFMGETRGRLTGQSRGKRPFYWDRVFVPDGSNDLTYSEIVDQFGLRRKMEDYSQSKKAMFSLLEHLRRSGIPPLWR